MAGGSLLTACELISPATDVKGSRAVVCVKGSVDETSCLWGFLVGESDCIGVVEGECVFEGKMLTVCGRENIAEVTGCVIGRVKGLVNSEPSIPMGVLASTACKEGRWTYTGVDGRCGGRRVSLVGAKIMAGLVVIQAVTSGVAMVGGRWWLFTVAVPGDVDVCTMVGRFSVVGSLMKGHSVVGLATSVVGLMTADGGVEGASVVVLRGSLDASGRGCSDQLEVYSLVVVSGSLLSFDASEVVCVLCSVHDTVVALISSGSLQHAPSKKPSMQAASIVPSCRMHSQLNMHIPVSPWTPSQGLLPIVHCFHGVTAEVYCFADADREAALQPYKQARVRRMAVHRTSITSGETSTSRIRTR